jgi:hypothetical protein
VNGISFDTAEDVINNSGYSLLQLNDVLSFWQNNTDRSDKLEVLFEIVFDATNNMEIHHSLFL